MNVSASGKAGPKAVKAWKANTDTSAKGSYSEHFTSGATPVVEGGKMLIANGVYEGLPVKERTYGT